MAAPTKGIGDYNKARKATVRDNRWAEANAHSLPLMFASVRSAQSIESAAVKYQFAP
jgi:hypothetical protein